ncbi:TPA: hypothetical protein ACOAY7_002798 [Vibrio cholerae]|uniref:hypothetical protein n=1 Tax=Vibrio cholerae TaxID=666 RepID=UPI000C6A64EC|nr:hypothetical protein [Vibrio phage JSF6]QVV97498.1 hypothetical protein 2017DRC106_0485 [Vibrio phage ICP1]QVV97725.1 hypothetical protein 2017DRC32_0485 [Vibrio phage ICP1]QVV97952.1 hypothetical protein 2017DRC48_0485 [Vibrio phage ICP1]QVV98179.1 hypothetical protein 2017DRC55_0485 [Vibrio phage ICP1]
MKLFGYEITIKKVAPVDAIHVNTTVHVQPDKPWPRQTKFAIVQMLIHRNCGNHLDEIKPESTLWDLCLDELDWVEVLLDVEKEFNIDIQIHDWECCLRMQSACDLIDKILMEK